MLLNAYKISSIVASQPFLFERSERRTGRRKYTFFFFKVGQGKKRQKRRVSEHSDKTL